MEYNKIIYNFIPNRHASLNVCLSDLLKIEDTYAIIDNASKPIRIYPRYLRNNVSRCSGESLIDQIEATFKRGVVALIINDFNIDFDYMRENIMPLINEYDACLYINNNIDSGSEDKLILAFTDKILDCSEEKWEDIKQQSYDSIANFMWTEEEDEDDDYDDEDEEYSYGEKFEELCKLLNENAMSDQHYDVTTNIPTAEYINSTSLYDDEKEVFNRFKNENIKECYSHTSNNSTLTLSLTADNDIIINDGQEAVKINNDKLNFFINTLKNLINI